MASCARALYEAAAVVLTRPQTRRERAFSRDSGGASPPCGSQAHQSLLVSVVDQI
jgi:hypothetical protein